MDHFDVLKSGQPREGALYSQKILKINQGLISKRHGPAKATLIHDDPNPYVSMVTQEKI